MGGSVTVDLDFAVPRVAREPVRVLLVEDDEDDYILTRDLLADATGRPFELEWAPTYQQGFARMVANEHDVYLLDYQLGPLTGVDLLHDAIAGGCTGPIVLLTGQTEEQTDLVALAAGASDYLVKGRIDAPLLERALLYAIQRKRAESEAADRLRELAEEQAARAAAEAAVRARDQILAIVSHDLRNPIGAISTLARFQLDVIGTNDPLRGAFETIHRSATRANRLIEDLLDVSRIEAGRLTIAPGSEPPAQIANEAVELLRGIAAERGIALTLQAQASLPSVRADRMRVLQVLDNLLGNALKFTQTGGTITVTVTHDGDAVRFAVRDTGAGIAADQLPHVFDRFWQATQGSRSGAGLGLAIAKGIVEAHGGVIGVESQPGTGSMFWFTLPVA